MRMYLLISALCVFLSACGGGGESGESATTYNSQIGAPASVIGADWTGSVEQKSGKMGLNIGNSIVLHFIDYKTIKGSGYNIIQTTSWSYDVISPPTGKLIMNFVGGKDEVEMNFNSACSGTYSMRETLTSGSTGVVSGKFNISGVNCEGAGRLYANPSKDQWNKTSDGRVGKIIVSNIAKYPIDVALWHPDDGSFFASQKFGANQSNYMSYNGKYNVVVGDNWGLQVPGQGVVNVSKVANYVTNNGEPYWEYMFVDPDNIRPVANAGPDQSIVTGTNANLSGNGSNDPNGDTLTYHWSIISKPENSAAVLTSANASTTSFSADKDGDYVLSLVVNDGAVDSEPDTVTVTAYKVNVQPVANAGSDRTVATSSAPILYGNDSSDSNGDLLTYSWSIVSSPTGSAAILSNTTIANPTFTADKDGDYVFSLTVNDGTVSSEPDTIVVSAISFSTSANFRIPDTNSTVDYTSVFGEDSDYNINTPSYTDNGDGTVTDNVTGLVWQKQDNGQKLLWKDAVSYCENLVLGQYSDWRMPGLSELASLIYIGNGDSNAINASYFEIKPELYSGYPFWSSRTPPTISGSALTVVFGNGSIQVRTANIGNQWDEKWSVRCVRSGN